MLLELMGKKEKYFSEKRTPIQFGINYRYFTDISGFNVNITIITVKLPSDDFLHLLESS